MKNAFNIQKQTVKSDMIALTNPKIRLTSERCEVWGQDTSKTVFLLLGGVEMFNRRQNQSTIQSNELKSKARFLEF